MRLKALCLTSLALVLLSSCMSKQRSCYVNKDCVSKTYEHKYGLTVHPGYWNDSGCNGKTITTLRDGTIVTQTFSMGKLEGETTYSFPHSEQIQKKEIYACDALKSQTLYACSGCPLESTEFDNPQSFTKTTWYDSGYPRTVERFADGMLIEGSYYNVENQKDSWVCHGMGERLNRDEHGFLISRDTICGGEVSVRTTFYPNNSPKEIQPIAQGVVHGDRKTFYPGGEPMSVETWDNGRQQGLTTLYQNGEKCAEIPYLSNCKHGVERRFSDGSTVTQEITWCDGRMHGPTYTYVGDSYQTDWFYKGRLTSRSNFESRDYQK